MRRPRSKAMKRRILLLGSYFALLTVILLLSVSALLSQTVLATTYVINDGDRVVTYTTFATDPVEVLEQAGVSLDTYDTYITEGASSITVNRAQRVTLHYHGETRVVSSQAETVGQLLERLGLQLTEEDVLSHDLEEPVVEGMQLWIDRVVVCQETFSAAVPHEVRHYGDASLPLGQKQILTRGQDGELLRTAEVTYRNGTETNRRILSETLLQIPVEEMVAVGSGAVLQQQKMPEAPVIGDGCITLPTGEVLTYTHTDTVEATAYTHTDKGCNMTTATGTVVRWGTVAVDPTRIPYGTRMFIVSNDGSFTYGIATAEDCGGDIKGDRMDLYMPTYQQCREFGRRRCTLYFLG